MRHGTNFAGQSNFAEQNRVGRQWPFGQGRDQCRGNRKIGLGVLAFVRVDADRNTGTSTKPLEDAIRKLPEVISCHYISGAGTFELQVLATDLEAFSRFTIDTLLHLPNVKDVHTSFSLGEVKAGGGVPLRHLRGG